MSGCVLDSDVVIAALDRRDPHHRSATRAIERMSEQRTGLLLSVVNYAEVLVRPADEPATLRAAVSAIDALGVELVAPTPAIARDAARWRGDGVSLPDGFAIATAHAHGCTLATFDGRVRRSLRGAPVKLAPGLPR
jgi:predicted nucleic acid-binding protein